MPQFGEVRVDFVTFTTGVSPSEANVTASVSGLIKNPTFSGDVIVKNNLDVEGNITVSGTVTGNAAGFTSVTGTTVTGTTANFTSGVFTTQVSGATITGDAGQFNTLTGNTAGFTSITGTTVTGTTANFATVSGTTVTGDTGNFTTATTTTATVTSGVFASGTAAAPSVSVGTTDNGLYSPGTDEVALATSGTGRLFVDSSGNVGVGTASPGVALHVDGDIRCDGVYGETDTNTSIQFPGSDVITFNEGGSEAARIDSSGRLGVGTSSPLVQLHCTEDIRFGDAITLSRSISTGLVTIADATAEPFTQGFAFRTNETSEAYRFQNGDGTSTYFTIRGSGRVGIGTTSPTRKLDISGSGGTSIRIIDTSSYAELSLNGAGTANFIESDDALAYNVGGSERMRIDSSGRLLVGTSTAPSAGEWNQYARIVTSGTTNNTSGAGVLSLNRGTAAPSISTGNALGVISFGDSSGNEFGLIKCESDAASGSGDYPGRLVFSTTANGAASPTERMRITEYGGTLFGVTSHQISANSGNGGHYIGYPGSFAGFAVADDPVAYFNRIGGDGTIITFRHAGVTEGSISSSGSTVQLNGAHLSRWSQLLDGGREEILRGTVLTNLDEMCEWGEEDNEQLNRMKVSDVEGDSNVAGVFVDWDNDDDTYTDDFYCAMTGDFIIRIAEGITVQRGDLLMSAGDGTAKPQDDDIVRSKTVAKVTSTHITCTYDDGSYCVPCVLMAC